MKYARGIMEARLAGLVYGTDTTRSHFVPPGRWTMGVMDKFDGPGMMGVFYRMFGRIRAQFTGISPVHLYRLDGMGEQVPTEGVTAYTLRNHKSFYDQGIRILLTERPEGETGGQAFEKWPVISYDGHDFQPVEDLLTDTGIVYRFNAENFVVAYIPDYGAVVLNTVEGDTVDKETGRFVFDERLKGRLNDLITAIEDASLAHLGRVKGKAAARMIWRKEKGLRKLAARLKARENIVKYQEKQLKAVGAVTPEQLSMEPVSTDGVYAFMDMVGSAKISRRLSPIEYVDLLNFCHEIVAETAARFGCRVDNMMGDGVYIQSVYVFDDLQGYHPSPDERLMLMTLLLASVIRDIRELAEGKHPLDAKRKVHDLVKHHRLDIGLRAGLSRGRALVGPLGSRKRKIVTAVGETVDLAARLETTGLPNHIHMPGDLGDCLAEARVTRDAMHLYSLARELDPVRQWNNETGVQFMDFYKAVFSISSYPLKPRGDTRCKEFSASDTFVMSCLPEKGRDTCTGI
ncbi:MAG: adenylate/guanylate cyclase domain-containing protein [Desulfobacterales bacterium]|nr:adenylate/guanylate cyclase domain-containing protein [Desulfobacterales bacterium]